MFTTGKLLLCLFEFVQLLLPLRFEPARDEAVLGIHGAVPAFGALRFILRAFDAQAPLRERGVVIRFEDAQPHVRQPQGLPVQPHGERPG